MSAPFQPGDVVVCVDDRAGSVCGRKNLKRGAHYRVLAVFGPYDDGEFSAFVFPEDYDLWVGWRASRFRKIDADVTEDFRQQLRSLKVPKPALNPSRHSREKA